MLLVWAKGVLGLGAGGVDLGDMDAARKAVATMRIGLGEDNVVRGVQDDGDDVLLADAHGGLEMVLLPGEDSGLKDLWGEVLWIGGQVLHQAVKVRGFGSGDEGRAAPVVQQGSRDTGGRRELLDGHLALMEPDLILRGNEKGGLRADAGGRGATQSRGRRSRRRRLPRMRVRP